MHETFDRHDVKKKASEIVVSAQPPVVCENCGNVLQHNSDAVNFWFNSGIGVPLGPQLSAFGCDSGQHWACSLDCWETIAHACVTHHLRATMETAHNILKQRKEEYQKSIQEQIETSKKG